jgi:hypothetical protein
MSFFEIDLCRRVCRIAGTIAAPHSFASFERGTSCIVDYGVEPVSHPGASNKPIKTRKQSCDVVSVTLWPISGQSLSWTTLMSAKPQTTAGLSPSSVVDYQSVQGGATNEDAKSDSEEPTKLMESEREFDLANSQANMIPEKKNALGASLPDPRWV